MGMTVTFCDRFRIEESGCAKRIDEQQLSRGWECNPLRFEYVENARNGLQRSGTKQSFDGAPMFAHIGDALKNRPELGFGNVAQDVVKRTELFLGLGKRPLNVELSSWTPAKGDTIAILVSLHPQRSFVEEISHFFSRSAASSSFEFESGISFEFESWVYV